MFYVMLNVIKSKQYHSKDNFIQQYFNGKPPLLQMNKNDVDQIMQKEMKQRYASPNIIFRNIKGKTKMQKNQHYSSLTGEEIEGFHHNNMTPFFGGSLKQNMDVDVYASTLEAHTGISKNPKKAKDHQSCFNDLHKNTNDYSPAYLTQHNRMEGSKFHTNLLPSKQIKVGQGYDSDDKFASKPSGGFQQTDLAYNANIYKSVDELRVKTNPKNTYEGVIIDGHKEFTRGEFKEMDKNRVETFYEKTQDHLFKTTGAVTKESMKPCQNVKKTSRQETTQEYKGPGYNPNKSIYHDSKSSGPVKKNSLGEYGARNVNLSKDGKKSSEDYGKKNIMVYQNERDITTTKTRAGNVSSLIKSLITPIQDALKPAQKEYMIQNARAFSGNINGRNKQTVHDPNGILRTTIKETTIHDNSSGGNLKVHPTNLIYDPSDVAKTTLKETMENYTNEINVQGSRKATLYDPDDIARTTMKQTTENSKRDGNVSVIQHGDGYRNTDTYAKNTNKELTSDNDYYGMPEVENGDGYKTSRFEAKNTNKELTSDNDYYGGGKNDVMNATSYEAIYNSTINDVNETLLKGREPTNSSFKSANGKGSIQFTKQPNSIQNFRTANNYNKISNVPVSKQFVNIQPVKNSIESTRLDDSLLTAFKNNPLTQSLHSAV